MESTNTILAWTRIEGKAKVNVRCLIDGRVLHSDELSIGQASQRSKFAKRLSKLGVDELWAERRLLEILNEVETIDHREAVAVEFKELEAQSVVRPELIISDNSTAIAIPMHRVTPGGIIRSEWHWYANDRGDRRRTSVSPTLTLGNTELIVSPIPSPPTEDELPRWSSQSRNSWLTTGSKVNGAELYYSVGRAIDRFVDFPESQRNPIHGLLVCWIILTYLYQAWDRVGYLLLQGPTNSGKSTLMRVLQELVFRPLSTENITAPALFRTLHMRGGTLLYDEAERLRDTRSPEVAEINSMLLAGYERKGRATRLERVGDSFVPTHYQVFGPKVIACISGVTPALAGRSISIRTERASKSSRKPKRLIREFDWKTVRDALHVFALSGHNWAEASRNRQVGRNLNARDHDVWQPILAIAAVLEASGVKNLTRMLERHAIRLAAETAELSTPEPDSVLLHTLTELSLAGERPTAQELLSRLNVNWKVIFERYTPGMVASRLRTYGLTSLKSNSRREYRVSREQLFEIQTRYGIDLDLA